VGVMWATMRLLMVALLAGAPLVAGKAKLVHNGDDTDLVTHELPGLIVGWRSAGPHPTTLSLHPVLLLKTSRHRFSARVAWKS
jgi:hypothetical protein